MTSQTLKKLFLAFLLTELLFAYAPAFAQTAPATAPVYDYSTAGVSTQIENLLCNPKLGGTGILYQCINQIYKFAIVTASVMGVFFIVIAGYVYMSADGNKESVDKAKDILVSTITSLVILLAGYILLNALNPDLIQFHGNTLQPVNFTSPATSNPLGTTVIGTVPAGCTTTYCVINGFDIGPYATAQTHEATVISFYNQLANRDFSSAAGIDAVIKSFAPNSPLTGAMVFNAAQSYNVDARLMVALMQVDSNLGTAGLGAQTGGASGGYNPGNVGNNGVGTVNYGSWQAGVNAVANWLNNHRAA
jgi:hypothetical protein